MNHPSKAFVQARDLGAGGSRLAPPTWEQTRIVVLTSSLLTDRMFVYSDFLSRLARHSSPVVWATSYDVPHLRTLWSSSAAVVESFPEFRPYKEFPYNVLRRLNEFAWDFRLRSPSRLSMIRHVRDKRMPLHQRLLKVPGKVLALLGTEMPLEKWVERLLLSYPRSPEASTRLRERPPALVVTTGPFQFEQPAIVSAAKNAGIPVMALIPSWDNLSTKNRMVFDYDAYLVWSDQTREELLQAYPAARHRPIHVVGAPQFDVFFQERFHQSRQTFCATLGLRPDLPVILYAVGSPNFLQEHHGALELARRIKQGVLGNVQMIVRPHPIHDNAEMNELFDEFAPGVVVQKTGDAGAHVTKRSQNEGQIVEWVNTFRHADVVVNLSSTVTIDAAILDRPVVNLDYDPEPGQPNQALVKDVNHLWTHFRPIAESGGVQLVNNADEMEAAVKQYLAHPELHREKRRWMAEYVCGFLDGRCGERMAEAILDFATNHPSRNGGNAALSSGGPRQ